MKRVTDIVKSFLRSGDVPYEQMDIPDLPLQTDFVPLFSADAVNEMARELLGREIVYDHLDQVWRLRPAA